MTEKNMKEKIDETYEFIHNIKEGKIKSKELRLPRKAKVRRSKLKKGYIGVIKIDENGNISGEKQKIEDSTLKLKEGTFHATDGEEILYWQGKFPVIIQPTWSKNPLDVRKDKPKNETYGQKYIMARMLKAVIVKKGGGKGLLWILGLAIAGYVIYSLFTGGI